MWCLVLTLSRGLMYFKYAYFLKLLLFYMPLENFKCNKKITKLTGATEMSVPCYFHAPLGGAERLLPNL